MPRSHTDTIDSMRSEHGSRESKVWAVLCTASADGTKPKYALDARHALLVMVRTSEWASDERVTSLLQNSGWRDVAISRVKLLREPFQSSDPEMLACYEGAVNKNGGIMIYSTPIPKAKA